MAFMNSIKIIKIKTFEELIKMRFNSSAIDPIYGKKDDASILVIDVWYIV